MLLLVINNAGRLLFLISSRGDLKIFRVESSSKYEYLTNSEYQKNSSTRKFPSMNKRVGFWELTKYFK